MLGHWQFSEALRQMRNIRPPGKRHTDLMSVSEHGCRRTLYLGGCKLSAMGKDVWDRVRNLLVLFQNKLF